MIGAIDDRTEARFVRSQVLYVEVLSATAGGKSPGVEGQASGFVTNMVCAHIDVLRRTLAERRRNFRAITEAKCNGARFERRRHKKRQRADDHCQFQKLHLSLPRKISNMQCTPINPQTNCPLPDTCVSISAPTFCLCKLHNRWGLTWYLLECGKASGLKGMS